MSSGELGYWQHLRILLWKNVIVPLLFCFLISGLHAAFPAVSYPVTWFTKANTGNNGGSNGGGGGGPPQGQINRLGDWVTTVPPALVAQQKRLALVPATPDLQPLVDRFYADVCARYPPINGSLIGLLQADAVLQNLYLPGFADMTTRAFSSEAALEAWVRSPSYPGLAPGASVGQLWAAVVFTGAPPSFSYTIRMNASDVPSTVAPYVDVLQRGAAPDTGGNMYLTSAPLISSSSLFGGASPNGYSGSFDLTKTTVPGFLALQLLVDRWVINRTLPAESDSLLDAESKMQQVMVEVYPGPSSCASSVARPGSLCDSTMVAAYKALMCMNGISCSSNATATAAWARGNLSSSVLAWRAGELYFPQGGIDVVNFPTLAYTDNSFYTANQYGVPLLFVLCFLFPISRLIRAIVSEKETKLTEGLAMMGVGQFALLSSWLVTFAIQFSLVSLAMAGILTGLPPSNGIFGQSGFATVFVLFFLFSAASIAYAAFISVFFSKARTASTLGAIAYLAAFFPYYGVGTATAAVGRGAKLGACVLPPTAFGVLINTIMQFEGGGTGVGLASPSASARLGGVAFSDGLALLASSTCLFLALAWYCEAALPNSMRGVGVALPWYFPCTRSYWASCCCCAGSSRQRNAAPSSHSSSGAVAPADPPPASVVEVQVQPKRGSDSSSAAARAGASASAAAQDSLVEPPDSFMLAQGAAGRTVALKGLVKVFSTPEGPRRAVDDLNLTMYAGQIFVLLGHNGAGKSTLVSILTGLLPPTAGSATLFGSDLGLDLQRIRRDLGVCPQHDVLWPELTVREHLRLFAAVKGISERAVAEAAVQNAAADVGIADKLEARVSELSGGMKRKLSVAIAFMGGSRVVFLDEPTSGMDPYSRRKTWDMLKRLRDGRVVLMSTHFMDEADYLGDRIGIMAHGRMHSNGTPHFLKAAHGVGYNLTLVRAADAAGAGALDAAALLAHIRVHVPEADLLAAAGAGREVIARLPLHASPRFPRLLAALEQLTQAGPGRALDTIGISVTTMEEVFLRIASGGGARAAEKGPRAAADPEKPPASPAAAKQLFLATPTPIPIPAAAAAAAAPHARSPTFAKHVYALSIKRCLYARRDVRSLVMLLAVPIGLVVIGFGVLRATVGGDQSNLLLRPSVHFNQDPSGGGGSVYPNHVPAFTFKASSTGPVDSPDVAAILRALADNAPADYYAGPASRMVISAAAQRAVPDPYGMMTPPATQQQPCGSPGGCCGNNCGPSYLPIGLSAMSAWLVAEREAGVGAGLTVTNGVPSIPPLEDGGSLYGAFVLTLNSSVFTQQDLRACFSASLATGSVRSDPASAAALFLAYSSGNNNNNVNVGFPSDALTYAIVYNATAYHAPPIFANLMHEALYRLRLAADATDAALGGSAGAGVAISDAVGAYFNASAGAFNAYNLSTLAAPALAPVRTAGSIRVSTHPLPSTLKEAATTSALFTFGAAAIVTLAFAFIPASYATFVVRERETGAKHQQLISGIGIAAYWASCFGFDYTAFFLPAAATVLAAWGFGITDFVSPTNDVSRTSAFVALFALYGAAVASFSYLLSFAFKSHTAAQTGVLLVSISSILLMIASMTMSTIGATCQIDYGLRFVFRLLPGYSLGNGLLTLCFLSLQPSIDAACAGAHGGSGVVPPPYDALDMRATGTNLVYLGVEAVVYWCLALAADAISSHPGVRRRLVRAATAADHSASRLPALDEDDDVKAERERISGVAAAATASGSGASGDSMPLVTISALRKVYAVRARARRGCCCCASGATVKDAGARTKVAVDDLSFGIAQGEVFGFLGVNGAGKTTTLQMLSGDALPTAGTAYMRGLDIVSQQFAVRRLLGYCPQFDALLELLTVREHLALYARIKGVDERDLAAIVESLLVRLDLGDYAGKLAGTLSGGNKRKLSVGVALIGGAPIVFLDEPSTGMDPVAKRHMWRVIADVAATPTADGARPSIVLTTHSMEEVEALCSRIGIMVDGRLRCLGSAQHLKARHGHGYQLQLQQRAPSDDEIDAVAGQVEAARARLASGPVAPPLPPPPPPQSAPVGLSPSEERITLAQAEAVLTLLGGPRAALAAEVAAGTGGTRAALLALTDGGRKAQGAPPAAAPRAAPRKGADTPAGAGAAAASETASTLPVERFVSWIAEEDLARAAIRCFTGDGAAGSAPPSPFHGGAVVERHGLSLRFSVPRSARAPLSLLFDVVERERDRLGIASYGLGETSLEAIFNSFAAQQSSEQPHAARQPA